MEEENEKKVFHVKCFQCVQCKVLTEQMVAVCREKGLHMCKYFGREFNTSLLSSLHLSISPFPPLLSTLSFPISTQLFRLLPSPLPSPLDSMIPPLPERIWKSSTNLHTQFYTYSVACVLAGHVINEISTTKRLFECTRCRRKTPLLGPGIAPKHPCAGWGNHDWIICGVHGTGAERAGMDLGSRGLLGYTMLVNLSHPPFCYSFSNWTDPNHNHNYNHNDNPNHSPNHNHNHDHHHHHNPNSNLNPNPNANTNPNPNPNPTSNPIFIPTYLTMINLRNTILFYFNLKRKARHFLMPMVEHDRYW